MQIISLIPPIQTKRLSLMALNADDAPQVQAKFARWEVVQYLANTVPWPYPPDGALSYIQDIALPAMRAGKAWHWAIRPKSDPQSIIGMISLMDNANDNRGFWITPEWWGRGIATEAAKAVTHYWFEGLNKPVLRVPKAKANTASRRISEAEGMRVIGKELRNYVVGPLAAELWEITREEWEANSQR